MSRRLKQGIYCLLCMKKFTIIYSLKDHLKNCHNYNPGPGDLGKVESRFLECHHCSERFHLADKEKLTAHLTKLHFPDIKLMSMISRRQIDTRYSWKDGMYKCNKCNKIVGSGDPKRGRIINYLHLNKVRFCTFMSVQTIKCFFSVFSVSQ